jgi:amino acid permease
MGVQHTGIGWSILHMTNTITGAAFLALPYQTLFLGTAGTNVVIVLYFLINLATLSFIQAVFMHEPRGPDLGRYVTHYCGRIPGATYEIFVVLSMIGSVCGFLIITRTCVETIVYAQHPDTAIPVRAIVIACFCVLVYLPSLLSLWQQRAFALLSIAALVFVVVVTIVRGAEAIPIVPKPVFDGFGMTGFQSLGVVAFAYTSQMNAMTIYHDLVRPDGLRIFVVNATATFFALAAYLLIANFGFLATGAGVTQNYLLDFDPLDGVVNAAKCLIVVKMFFTFPLMMHPLLQASLHLLENVVPLGKVRAWVVRAVVGALVVAASGIVANYFDELSTVFSVTGAVADSFISITLPAALVVALAWRAKESKVGLSWAPMELVGAAFLYIGLATCVLTLLGLFCD